MKKFNVALILLALVSCNKDDIKTASPLEIGSDSKTKITETPGADNDHNFIINLNNDNTDDFSIQYVSSDADSQMGPVSVLSIKIICLHEAAFFYGTSDMINMYDYVDTTYYQNQGPVQMTIAHHLTNIENTNQVASSSQTALTVAPLSAGESINTDLSWQNGESTLLGLNYNTVQNSYAIGSDTMLYNTTNYDYSKNDIEVSEDFYIGVKVIKNSKEKLGWIKLSKPGVEFQIYEYAIQK